MKSTQYYDKHAASLCSEYDAIDPEVVHQSWAKKHLPVKPGFACDLGAGSGRDALWLASKGWDVIAVEPSVGMRERARAVAHPQVTWLDDAPGCERWFSRCKRRQRGNPGHQQRQCGRVGRQRRITRIERRQRRCRGR